jgi:hypothetical protein
MDFAPDGLSLFVTQTNSENPVLRIFLAPSAIPEPSTLILATLGLLSLAWRRPRH